jgi:hypothetical protein
VNRGMDEMSVISLGRIEDCKARISCRREEGGGVVLKDGSAVE